MKEIIATLMFDSWSDRIPECRSNRPEDRHLIYEGEGIILDLLLKQDNDGACIHVGGQVLSEDAVEEEVSDQPVRMEQGRHRASTHTNALGEFSFHTVPSTTLDLCIVLGKRRFQVRGLGSQQPKRWQVVPSFAAGGD